MIHALRQPGARANWIARGQTICRACRNLLLMRCTCHRTFLPGWGMWQADIDSNLAAIEAAKKQASRHMHVGHHSPALLGLCGVCLSATRRERQGQGGPGGDQRSPPGRFPRRPARLLRQFSASCFGVVHARDQTVERRALPLQPPSDVAPYKPGSDLLGPAPWLQDICTTPSQRGAALDKFNAMVEATRKSPNPTLPMV